MPTPNLSIAEYKALPQKRSKYNATPTVIDGIRFASKHEAKCWTNLQLLFKAKKITGLRRQVRYELHAPHWETGELVVISRYVADFVWIEDGKDVISDAKGYPTAIYKLKKAWMKAEYGIEIREL